MNQYFFRIIREWDPLDFTGLMEFIKPHWYACEWGYWKKRGNKYYISTAGWSDNEEIVANMEKNFVWWAFHWYSSMRGGHYVFIGRDIK